MNAPCCIVTGGSRGIGRATALRFARDGYQIVIAARDPERLTETGREVEACGVACERVALDLTQTTAVQALIRRATERFGRIDVLVNNAGHAPLSPIDDLSDEEFERTWRLNVTAVFAATRAVIPVMRAQGGGTIVNVSSVASVDPFRGFAVYGASKAWVNLFTQAVAAEHQGDNIRAFAVAPGAVETELLRGLFKDLPPEACLDPAHVADVISAVCQPAMKPCSGQTIFVRK